MTKQDSVAVLLADLRDSRLMRLHGDAYMPRIVAALDRLTHAAALHELAYSMQLKAAIEQGLRLATTDSAQPSSGSSLRSVDIPMTQGSWPTDSAPAHTCDFTDGLDADCPACHPDSAHAIQSQQGATGGDGRGNHGHSCGVNNAIVGECSCGLEPRTTDSAHPQAAGSVKLQNPELQRQLDASVARFNELPQWMKDAAAQQAAGSAPVEALHPAHTVEAAKRAFNIGSAGSVATPAAGAGSAPTVSVGDAIAQVESRFVPNNHDGTWDDGFREAIHLLRAAALEKERAE